MAADNVQAKDLWGAGILSVVLAAALWWWVAHPRTLDVAWQGSLTSASFAPFRDGQSPLQEIFPTPEQIEEDLVRLKGIFDGVVVSCSAIFRDWYRGVLRVLHGELTSSYGQTTQVTTQSR